jgi:hypothetical protein
MDQDYNRHRQTIREIKSFAVREVSITERGLEVGGYIPKPPGVEDSHGWFIRRCEGGFNEPCCPTCFATLRETDSEMECPNGHKLEVCRDFLCPWCVFGRDPFCEDK